MGAIASGGIRVLNEDVVRSLNIPDRVIEAVTARELRELRWRERAYRGDRPPPDGRRPHRDPGGRRNRDRLDDAGRRRRFAPARASPGHRGRPDRGTLDLRRASGREADECICVIMPDPFYAVGVWYEDFSQTTDEEVRDLLDQAASETTAAQPA